MVHKLENIDGSEQQQGSYKQIREEQALIHNLVLASATIFVFGCLTILLFRCIHKVKKRRLLKNLKEMKHDQEMSKGRGTYLSQIDEISHEQSYSRWDNASPFD